MQSFRVSIHLLILAFLCCIYISVLNLKSLSSFFYGNSFFPSTSFLHCRPQLPLTPTYPYMFSLSLKELVGRLLQKQSYLKEELRNYLFLSPQAPTLFIQLISFPFPLSLSLSYEDTHTHTCSLLCCLNHNYADISLFSINLENVSLSENVLEFPRLILFSQ